MSEGQKLHTLLKFMSKVHTLLVHTEPVQKFHAKKTTYTYEQLLKAFKKRLFRKKITIDEISYLCSILIFDGLAELMKRREWQKERYWHPNLPQCCK